MCKKRELPIKGELQGEVDCVEDQVEGVGQLTVVRTRFYLVAIVDSLFRSEICLIE